MSKTKTKRMVASFLLLCAMSGGGAALADPDGWTAGADLSGFGPNIVFDTAKEFTGGSYWGGAFYLSGNNTKDFQIDLNGSSYTFKNIVSQDSGAGIYLASPNWALTSPGQVMNINGTTLFEGNRAGANSTGVALGGAVYNTSTINFNKYAQFISNRAENPDGTKGSGGAVNSDGVMNFNEGVLFKDNYAAAAGGALHNGSNGTVTVKGGTFTGNKTKGNGGAIYSANSVVLDSSKGGITFSGNIAGLNTDSQRYNDVYLTKNGELTLKGNNQISFGGSIEGAEGSVISSAAGNLVLNGDNSAFEGTFTQNSGKTTVKNKFFGGSNTHQIKGGELVIAVEDAISNAKISMADGSNLTITADTVLNGNVTGTSNVKLDNNANLQLIGNSLDGSYTQNSGSLTIGDGNTDTDFFQGTNNITGGTVTVKNNAELRGENNINGANVTVESGASSTGKLNVKKGVVTLADGSTLAGSNTISGGTVNINTSNNSTATNTITGGIVNIGSGVTFNGANTTLADAGNLVLADAVLNGLKEMTGGTLKASGTEFQGTANIKGGVVNISDGSSIVSGGSLNITGGTVNINQGITLTDNNIQGNGGTLNMTQGNTELNIQGVLSGFTGDFNKNGGTINIGQKVDSSTDADSVKGGSFFGGSSDLTNVTVNMHDKSEIAVGEGDSLNLSGSTINIDNSGLSKDTDDYGVALSNGKESTISGTVTGDSNSIINVGYNNGKVDEDGDTYLVVNGDMSGYQGSFIQHNGTTEVTGGKFFGGTNTIKDGNFIFRDEAELTTEVSISGEDVKLTIGDGSQGYTIQDGNKVYVTDTNGDGVNDLGFVLENVRLTETIFDDSNNGENISINDSNLRMAEEAGFGANAKYELGGNGGTSANITMEDGSAAADGASLKLNDGSTLTIDADVMKTVSGNSENGYTFADGGKFEMDITGDAGIVYVNRKQGTSDDDYSQILTFTSDNSGFGGRFVQSDRKIKFEGKSGEDAAHFFDGINSIQNNSEVTFGQNSVIHGTNIIDETSSFVMENGSSIDIEDGDATRIILDGGKLDIVNTSGGTEIDLNIGIENTSKGANINKTADGNLTISANQHGYSGNYNQTGSGTTTVNAGNSFFGGKNTISNGVVDLTQTKNDDDSTIGAALAGANTITGNGKMIIGDFTDTSLVQSPVVVNDTDNGNGLILKTTDGNDKNLEINFAISGNEKGKVTHDGNGALNLNNAGGNDLFAKFDGIFEQTSTGVTNVFGKSFKNNNIKNGTLNLKNGAELVDGETTIGSNGVLNIGTIDDDTTVNPVEFNDDSTVTISADVKGEGKVNISQGTTTITSTSDNSAFTGSYHQTGGNVVATNGSIFFGAVNNLIEKGKLFFHKGAQLADKKSVTLDANTDLTGKTENTTAVLDLDGRDNAKFTGGNTLYIDDNTTEGFVFTDGILQNALLYGEQNIGANTVITMQGGSGFASDAVVDIDGNGTNVILGTGAVAEEGADLTVDSTLTLVSQDLDFKSEVIGGSGNIRVEKDMRETGAPNINIYGDQSNFEGQFYQDAGRVTVTSGATFFGGSSNEITGITVTNENGEVVKETSGDLYLEKGSYLGSDITVTNSDKTENAGVSTPHGRVFVEDKIFTQDGKELTDIDELIDQNNLYYNNIVKEDGTIDVDSLKQININNGGLILSNGTIFETTDGPAVFERKENGIIDIGFANNTGVNGDIVLKRDTMLSYGDNAYIKDDSTLTMEDTAILNFINDSAVINYNPEIVGGGSIYKEGLAATNISSAIDMTGEVNVKEGTLNFTSKDKVIFKKGDDLRQTGNLTVGSNSANANLNIVAKQTEFQGDVTANAQDGTQSGLYLLGKNTNIGGNLSVNNTITSITGNTSIGGDWNIDGNSSLNMIGNSANTIDVAGDLILGSDLKDGKLPVAFDYDPHSDKMDTIIVDSFINDKNSPLLITGINFVSSPADRTFSLDADRFIQQRNPDDQPYYDPTNFYANTAMGRYYLSNGAAGGSDFTGTLVHLNPQQYRGQVATIASWQNQLVVNNMLFDHMDVITRQLMDDQKTANKYAASMPQFAPYQYDLKGGSLWYKAYGNFERLSMTKGLSVGNNAYGSLIGADFPLIKLKHGWNLVPTAYIGYNGAHQHFNGTSMYQNGAQLGLMGTAYKGNFITSLLAYGGGYANDMSMRGEYGSGSDNTGNWFAGVASKTAYNIHLPADFIFQPTLMAAYNAFGSQNWGSDFGVLSMSSGMLNGINVAPGFNLIWQKKTFNIYATAQMVYNIMGGVDGRAGNIDLGYVRMRHSYFEYGLGVSKTFKDRFNGFLQFTIRNGGRTGIGFSGGLQFKVGK